MSEAEQYDPGRVTLQTHPSLLESAVVNDHVETWGFGDGDWQFEVTGETDADELEIEWTKIEINPEKAAAILHDGEQYVERCEDLQGREYKLIVNGGERDPKGSPIHTEAREEVPVDE